MTLFNKKIIRRRYAFYGSVQAVGFRYRAMHAAQLYGATGWVKNERYGSVTMEIQGTEAAIDQVLLSVEAGRYIWIENMDVRSVPLVEAERGFRTL